MTSKSARSPTSKGIFCLEGDWWGKLHKPSSVEPILELLHQWDPFHVPYVRRDVATREEFEYYLGSCDTLDLHGNSIRAFLRRTSALAVCGYRKTVDWLDSVALELMVLSAMQEYSTTIPGAKAMKRNVERRVPYLAKQLGFHMVVKS